MIDYIVFGAFYQTISKIWGILPQSAGLFHSKKEKSVSFVISFSFASIFVINERKNRVGDFTLENETALPPIGGLGENPPNPLQNHFFVFC
ncbi:hypothetical protein BCD64_02030 [Nostoc sp. MBR 210]|nr:hypothetical protein BCD64_02030 [Nostoc sp. MBR 210]